MGMGREECENYKEQDKRDAEGEFRGCGLIINETSKLIQREIGSKNADGSNAKNRKLHTQTNRKKQSTASRCTSSGSGCSRRGTFGTPKQRWYSLRGGPAT